MRQQALRGAVNVAGGMQRDAAVHGELLGVTKRQHMLHARQAYNPADFVIDPALLNPFNDPRVSDEDAVRHSLDNGALCGTPARVAEQLAEIRDAGVHHVLAQMSFGYVPHDKVMGSMRRFAEQVMPRFRD